MDNIVGCINMLLYFLSQGNFYFKVVHWSFCQECQTNMEEGLGQVLWRKHIIPLANQTSAIGNDGALKLNDLTTHCEAKGEDTEHQFYLFFFSVYISLTFFLVIKSYIKHHTTIHMETQSWNIRPDLKARGWEGGGGGWGGRWVEQRLLEQGTVKEERVGGLSLLLHVEN